MYATTNRYVPQFDFGPALALPIEARFEASVSAARRLAQKSGYQRVCDFPCVPVGASESEISSLESRVGIALPNEYRRFLSLHRYLKLGDGLEVGGLDHEGVYVTEVPWISTDHRAGEQYLVFANYWAYADGDQLMFDLSDPSAPVVAYLHEHGPAFEFFAPSFSTALWRLVGASKPEKRWAAGTA